MVKLDSDTTVEDLLHTTELPVVAIDQASLFTYMNDAFIEEYGWTREELIGKSVVEIMPRHMRSGHNIGFSRFLATEKSNLLNKRLPLQIRYRDGREKLADHFIVGEKKDDLWRFAAAIDYPNEND